MVKSLGEEDFLWKLGELYGSTRTKGTVYLGMKRYVGIRAAQLHRKPQKQLKAAEGEEPRLLVRARVTAPRIRKGDFKTKAAAIRKKNKISTIVLAKDIERFQTALTNVMRLHMDGLKKPKPAKTKQERKKNKGNDKDKKSEK
eukprot:CAMPEP_0206455160 /NCGR_PEP_ID=MMETSP0324_2-20121206/21585_1 /ASSEMBLY_ACC=CAM_ASM_000836 /TAXON_ID=2866 /ORGANISM="Crypthecodinium cohnii, Strain Seligo" /LENGTH=142 /DNA_ID=CAMNT_0053925807 /DNA_START=58 /DNA_END=486 /DNA_ORIENTATION=-